MDITVEAGSSASTSLNFRVSQVALLWCMMLTACAAGPSQSSSPRRVIDLDTGWRFVRRDVPSGENPQLDDSAWQQISLPHTWNNLDGEDGGNNYYRGPAWYRLHLNLSDRVSDLAGRRVYLRFGAASMAAKVFVNGKPAGEHKGAFAGFVFDITDLLNVSGDNVVAVRVTNAHDADIPPLSGDFTIFGGLYRSVSLLMLDPLSISPIDDGGPGVYAEQNSVTRERAQVHVIVRLRNANPTGKNATVVYQVLDSSGKLVLAAQGDQAVPAAGFADAAQDLTIADPHLWNGRLDPYLYTLRVTVNDGQAKVDQLDQPLGLRFFRVDPASGFYLNGSPYSLHGVNRHQDRIDEGWATRSNDLNQDFDLVMEMGCTVIRLAHYQHPQEFYDLCDRGGLIVWAEASMVNFVTASQAFDDTALQQVRELIKQNYNHPSICFWSLYNELSGDKKSVAHQALLVGKLNALAHQLDATRLTTAASSVRDPLNPINQITDILGHNLYFGWYYGKPGDLGKSLDEMHAKRPDYAIALSEYGAGASVFQHDPDPKMPKKNDKHWHPEEWQTLIHESAWRTIKQRPWLWGSFLWCMFDFAVDSRDEGDHAGRNDKGMITYDRRTKKDVFYFYKANWSDDPFVYITYRRFTPRNFGTSPVKIYSNCDRVELIVNGHSFGTQTGDDIHRFVWDDVHLNVGDNQFQAVGNINGKQFRDQCTITFNPNATTRQSAAAN